MNQVPTREQRVAEVIRITRRLNYTQYDRIISEVKLVLENAKYLLPRSLIFSK